MYHELLVDLQENNLFFDELVDMIPTKLYIAGQSGDDYNPKYFKGHSKDSKVARRAKNKQSKRAKFDPELSETTTQAKKRLEGDNTGGPQKPVVHVTTKITNNTTKGTKKSPSKTVVVTPKDDDDEATAIATTITTTTPDNDNNKKSRIEALREKLHAKLAEKRGNRPSDPNTVSKRAARRAEKKKRQEEAIKRNKKKTTSNAEKNSNNKRFKMSEDGGKGDRAADLSQVDFGRLAGLNPIGNGNYTEVNKALKNLSKSKNLEKLLADAESKKQRLEELKKSGKAEDKAKADNIEWGNVIKEATGERVKDDPAKIKKVLQRKAAKKKKSAKAWKNRMDTTKQNMDERQNIRNHNLNQRKAGGQTGANLSSKRIELEGDDKNGGPTKQKNDGRRLSRAGFEGRKQDFLNKN